MKRCHRCGRPWSAEKRQPGVKDVCDQCASYLHCCLNCRFHDPTQHNQCGIPTTEWVADKAGANFCDEFEFKDSEAQAMADAEQVKAREAFERLFGKPNGPAAGEPPKKFNDLFGG